MNLKLKKMLLLSCLYFIVGSVPFVHASKMGAPHENSRSNEVSGTRIMNKKYKKFTPTEDKILTTAVDQYGTLDWEKIAESLPGRNKIQCRDRWNNYLSPYRNGNWTQPEDEILIEKHSIYGNDFVKIAKFLQGRSCVQVKNRWYKLRRRNQSVCTVPTSAPTQDIVDTPDNTILMNTPMFPLPDLTIMDLDDTPFLDTISTDTLLSPFHDPMVSDMKSKDTNSIFPHLNEDSFSEFHIF